MSAGEFEVEIKLAFPDAITAADRILSLGFAESAGRIFEANMVYDTADGLLRGRGELLRLRQAASRTVLTWKGPSVTGRHKARPEVETDIGEFEQMDRILRSLGYVPVFRYEKYRTEFAARDGRGTAMLDETPIGCFVELEGDPEWIDSTAGRLGFSDKDYIKMSYGSLYQRYRERTARTEPWMTFR